MYFVAAVMLATVGWGQPSAAVGSLIQHRCDSWRLLAAVFVSCIVPLVCGGAQRGRVQSHIVSQAADVINASTNSQHITRVGTDDDIVDYDEYVLLKLQVNGESLAAVHRLQELPELDFWTLPSALNPTSDVLVPPHMLAQVTHHLDDNGVGYKLTIANLKTAIAVSSQQVSVYSAASLLLRQGHAMSWDTYHRHDTILQYLSAVARRHNGSCRQLTVGHSYEGRRIAGVSCGSGPRRVWIDGGIHAREWISPAVVTYIIRELSDNASLYDDILSNFTIHIIPVLNPDGYEFSHTKNRMWRKTRSRNWMRPLCAGTDPNRNFDVAWMTRGTSSNPCSQIYAGHRPFSENETRAVRKFLLKHKDTVEMYISMHSYSQMIFVPYAYNTSRPSNYHQMEKVALKGAEALQKTGGPEFQVGQASRLLYAASGGSDDWARQVAGIRYSFTFELRDDGHHGFLLPPSLIEQSGRESMAAVYAMIRAI